MDKELSLKNVELFEPEEVLDDLLLRVHPAEFIEDLKTAWYSRGAYLTIGGCVRASEMLMEGKLRNALCFGVAAGHHAERNYAWGGTYASVCGPLVINFQEKYPGTRIAILDTDAHHGNGTRDVTMGNHDVLHVCFCSVQRIEDEGTKICINPGYHPTDDEYLNLVETEFISRIQEFRPDIIIHLLGHDTAKGDYGSRGLSKEFFLRLVEMVKNASKICNERYIINTHGGSVMNYCEYIYTNAIRILAKD